jgi:hypothetical protein
MRLLGDGLRRVVAAWSLGKFAMLLPALGFAGFALALRATVDHSFVTLYTGDNGEELTLAAARNFQKLGFPPLKYLPVHYAIEDGLARPPRYYTHSPPLPPLLVGATYAISGGSIVFSRLIVILITLAGVVFATLAARDLADGLVPGERAGHLARMVMPLLLATNAGILCYGDALTEVPIQETWQWMLLFFCIRLLRSPGSPGLFWLAGLSALQVWTALDWIVANAVVLAWCLFAKPMSRRDRWLAILVVHGLGMALPLCLRLAQNAWALGGVGEVFQDLYQRALFRAGGDSAYPYALSKHMAHFGVAMIWLCGLAAPLLIWLNTGMPAGAEAERPVPMRRLFLLWGLGSLSFQLLMPQAAMYHAYTTLHPANFVLLWGAVSAARMWDSRPFAVSVALSLQLLWGGAVFTTEIAIPFLRDSTTTLSRELCPQDQAELSQAIPEMSSSVSRMVGRRLAPPPPTVECGARSTAARTILWGYLRVIRASSLE